MDLMEIHGQNGNLERSRMTKKTFIHCQRVGLLRCRTLARLFLVGTIATLRSLCMASVAMRVVVVVNLRVIVGHKRIAPVIKL